ncbi:MAG: hypothetical protein HWE16_18320 [Gammaproteobacteria bacterium]|nr:hypothetical protein [Gammaproteobacteria bacterium]
MKYILTIAVAILTLMLTGCETYGYSDRDSGYQKQYPSGSSGIFTDSEKRLIRDYYSGHGRDKPKKAKKLPKGLQKKYERTGQLPPGWQKKMARGEVIPGDVYVHGRDIPDELRRRLPIGPVGSKVLEIEGKIVRVIHNTREIIDILDL